MIYKNTFKFTVSSPSTFMPPCGHLPEMQVQYSSARRSSSKEKVTLDGSGQGVCRSGVTLDPGLSPDLVGVQGSREDGRGEPTCWARFVLKTRNFRLLNSRYKLRCRASDAAVEPAEAIINNEKIKKLDIVILMNV